MKTDLEIMNFFAGIDEVELTDELIYELVKQKKWDSVESLIKMREMGATWNIETNRLVMIIN
ncbi:MAG: hypothetical protein EBW68_07160 [Actinobacteria bacterium]|jgi:hypothetical protein|nr:hypothetical protein [Actinomycetota bacterium]|tara:strand:+ start:57 stop:242 length:186 start_codon:yes stop_codon:yes gene_type:complete